MDQNTCAEVLQQCGVQRKSHCQKCTGICVDLLGNTASFIAHCRSHGVQPTMWSQSIKESEVERCYCHEALARNSQSRGRTSVFSIMEPFSLLHLFSLPLSIPSVLFSSEVAWETMLSAWYKHFLLNGASYKIKTWMTMIFSSTWKWKQHLLRDALSRTTKLKLVRNSMAET